MAFGHEALFDVPEFQSVQRQHVFFVALLLIFVPAETLRGQHKPVVSRTASHDAQVVDAHPSFPDALVDNFATGGGFVLCAGLGARSGRNKTTVTA